MKLQNLIKEFSNIKIVKVGNSEIEYAMTRRGHAQEEYSIKLISGHWPKNNEIINALGGNDVFGGKINVHQDRGHAIIYIDQKQTNRENK